MTTTHAVAQDNMRGAVLLALSGLVVTFEVVLVRMVADQASIGQIVFFRALAQLVLVVAWIAATDPGLVRTGRPVLQVARGLTSLFCWSLYYVSFVLLDLSLATTLTFTTSLFVVALAAPMLGERVGPRRIAATLVGFGGVALVTRLGAVDSLEGVIYGLASAAAAAILVFQNRVLSRTEPTVTIMLYIGVVTVLGTAPVAVLDWRPLTSEGLTLVVLAGSLGAFGMWLSIEAYRVGEVSALAPVPYLRIVFAIAAGYVFFAEVPAWTSLAGAAIIVAAAIFVTRAEKGRKGLSAPHR